MFLNFLSFCIFAVKSIFSFIEDYPVTVGIIISAIVGSLWFRTFLMQKRAEASFGFYTVLTLRLKCLYTLLKEHDLLNASDSEKGNIYSLIYSEDCLKKFCPAFNEPSEEAIESIHRLSTEIKEILLNADCNIYPYRTNKEQWYQSQYMLLSFCDFMDCIKNKERYCKVNTRRSDGEFEDKHIVKCKHLVESIDYLQEAIHKTKY